MRTARLISVVVPLLNEERGVGELYRRTVEAIEASCPSSSCIVDDGSTDGTAASCSPSWPPPTPRLKVLERSRRNFGHQAALTAGLDHARRRRGRDDGR